MIEKLSNRLKTIKIYKTLITEEIKRINFKKVISQILKNQIKKDKHDGKADHVRNCAEI